MVQDVLVRLVLVEPVVEFHSEISDGSGVYPVCATESFVVTDERGARREVVEQGLRDEGTLVQSAEGHFMVESDLLWDVVDDCCPRTEAMWSSPPLRQKVMFDTAFVWDTAWDALPLTGGAAAAT